MLVKCSSQHSVSYIFDLMNDPSVCSRIEFMVGVAS